jgi:cytochrome c biogenesis protein CcmG/thiol:disulfide interchange protein DsbE
LVIPVIAVLALGALFLFGLLRGAPDRDIKSAYLGATAPGFTLPLYEEYQQEYQATSLVFDPQNGVALEGYGAVPLVINFWASWCIPCYQEAPVLQRFWQQYQDQGILFVGIHTQNRDGYAAGRDFIQQFGLTFPNGFDRDSDISIDWGLYGVPETFFVDASGTVTLKHVGPVTDQLMAQQMKALLN